MFFKISIFVLLVLITVSLFRALVSLVKGKESSGKTARMLTYRVAFSVLLLIFLGVAKFMGWVEPHGVVPHSQEQNRAQSSQQHLPEE